jgi:hypothetical protein
MQTVARNIVREQRQTTGGLKKETGLATADVVLQQVRQGRIEMSRLPAEGDRYSVR